MKVNRYISIISCLLLQFQHLELQNDVMNRNTEPNTLRTSNLPTTSSSNLTLAVPTTNLNTNLPTEKVGKITSDQEQKISTPTSISRLILIPLSTLTSIPSGISSTNSTSMSITQASQIIVTNQKMYGKYSSKIRIKCSFPDTFKSDYANNKSPILFAYLQALVDRIAVTLFQRLLLLVRVIVFSVNPGSVLIDMAFHLRSDVLMNDTLLMASVRNSVVAANTGVTIFSIRVLQSSKEVNTTGKWIIGLIFALVIAVVLIIVALLLFYRYCPNHRCCRSKPPNNVASVQNGGPETMVEMEFENVYDDRDSIIDRGSSRV